MHSETLDPKTQERGDFKEALNFGELDRKPQNLPKCLDEREDAIRGFQKLCHRLCVNLLRLFALGLEIDPHEGGEDWFVTRHDPSEGPSGSVLRWLYYPKVKKQGYDATGDIRAGAHSDYGSLTLLFQRSGQPGLEIMTPSTSWSPVPIYPPGTEDDAFPPILVNIGDLMHFWTNGMLKSTVHRVVFPDEEKDRFSIAYFCHPLDHVEIEAVPSPRIKGRVSGEQDVTRESITAAAYLNKRLEETYRWGRESPHRD